MSAMPLIEMAGSAWLSKAISVAAGLGIADLLDGGEMTVAALADGADADPEILDRLLRFLASCGIFEISVNGLYRNSPGSLRLRANDPQSLRHFCILAGEEYYEAFGDLSYTVKTGRSAFRHRFGDSIYGYMDAREEKAAIYDKAMGELSRPLAGLLASELTLSDAHTVVDIGGGDGTVIRTLLGTHPHLTGICFDRQSVIARTALGIPPSLAGRMGAVAGDFFIEVPSGADVYVLKNVLHNWNEDSCLAILSQIRKAMLVTPNARLAIVEPLFEHSGESRRALMNALFQSVICEDGTQSRTRGHLAEMVKAAQLHPVRTVELATGHTLVETVA